MKVGAFFNYQNLDWDQFNARSPEPPKVSGAEIYDEELHLAGLLERHPRRKPDRRHEERRGAVSS